MHEDIIDRRDLVGRHGVLARKQIVGKLTPQERVEMTLVKSNLRMHDELTECARMLGSRLLDVGAEGRERIAKKLIEEVGDERITGYEAARIVMDLTE